MTGPYEQKLNDWFATDEGKACVNISGLESAPDQAAFKTFLIHRLERAFAAGWDGCHVEVAKVIKSATS